MVAVVAEIIVALGAFLEDPAAVAVLVILEQEQESQVKALLAVLV
jgi:hypothetical protein